MDTLASVVRQVMSGYVGGSPILRMYLLDDEAKQIYAVIATDYPVRRRPAAIAVMAHIEGEYVIIDEDITDRPLYKALAEAGIPRERVIAAYAGEALPTAAGGG